MTDALYGPFTVEVGVYLTNGDDVQATAKCVMPVGEPPTLEHIKVMLAEAERMAKTQNPDLKLMSRNEFENTIIAERTGGIIDQHFATASEWDVPAESLEAAGFKEALRWCSASPDFQVGGQAREGWLKVVAPLLYTPEEVESLRKA